VLETDAHTGIRIRSINPEGGWSEARVRIALDGSAMSVDWRNRERVVTKNYSRTVVAELVRIWGSPSFDIAGWTSDICPGNDMIWIAEAGGHVRELCHAGPEVRRLAEFKATIQSLMKGP
jgi:hypothetical protein